MHDGPDRSPPIRIAIRDLASDVASAIIRDLIASGRVAPGQLLPGEAALASRYAVSRGTLRAALRTLQDAQLVSVRNGVGAVVLPRPSTVTEGLDQLCSLETYTRDTGASIATADLTWTQEPADDEAARQLQVEPGALLSVAHRVKLIDGARAGWGIERTPADLVPFEALQAEYAGSIMDVLLARPELGITHADAEIAAVPLPAGIARRLGVRAGRPAQYLEQVMLLGDGRPAQWGRAWLLPEHFRFRIRRRTPLA